MLDITRKDPFFFYPDADYSVGLIHYDRHVKLTAMRNPWKSFDSLPLGRIVAQWGGGGHQRVGSAIFPIGELAKAQEALRELAAYLRHRPFSPVSIAQ